jgi:hypothetical protein
MSLDSLTKRLATIEGDLEPQTVTARLRNGALRVYDLDTAMQAMRDACSSDDTSLLIEISEIEAYRDDSGGVTSWLTIARTIHRSRQRIKREEKKADATAE